MCIIFIIFIIGETINFYQKILIKHFLLVSLFTIESLPNSLTSSFSGLPAIPASDSRPMTTCSHRAQSAGQDLCYLCHQRNERNKPVMVDDEKRAMEEMEDKMLYEYLCTKDKHSIAVEKVTLISITRSNN